MSTILNDRDVLIESLPRNIAPSQGRAFVLGADTPVFTVDTGGLGSPSLIHLTTQLINIVGTVSWSVTGASGVTVSGDSLSATLAFSDVTASTISVQAQVSYLGVTYLATQVLQKVTQGIQGNSTAQVYAYKRAVSAPVDNPGAVTWTFASATITTPSTDALANGWTKTIPSGTDPLYVTLASALGAGATDTIAAGEWATPVKLVQDGLNGLNSATVFIYQRAASTPTLPSATTTYTFNTGVLTGLNNGWSYQIPAGTNPLYVSQATAASNTTTDTILSSEWAAAQILVQNGTNGSPGNPGSPGTRGTVNLAQSGFSSWSDSAANSLISSSGYGSPIQGDIVTLYSASFSQTRFYSSGSWLVLTAYINGNLLVSDTLAADKITAGSTLSGVNITGGTLNIGSGQLTVSSGGLVDAYNFFGHSSQFGNLSNPSVPSVTVNNTSFSSVPGIQVSTSSSSGTSSNAVFALGNGSCEAIRGQNNSAGAGGHGVRGTCTSNSSGSKTSTVGGVVAVTVTAGSSVMSGLVGAANGYDFYADGAGTNYGPFTGAHDILWPLADYQDLGDILVDVECIVRSGWSNTLFRIEKSSQPYQKASIGVLASYVGRLSDQMPAAFREDRIARVSDLGPSPDVQFIDVISPIYNERKGDFHLGAANALGEGQMNVCGEGGDIAAGDFIVTSSLLGKGMRMDMTLPVTFDLLSCIVARARENVAFSSPTEVKQVACIYRSG
jgi:hypothetical protein